MFDLDGVISDASWRQYYLRGGRRDWRGFFTAAQHDPPLQAGLGLFASVARKAQAQPPGPAPVILTARPNYVAGITRRWLADHGVHADLLILRPSAGRGSYGSSTDFKHYELSRLRSAGYQVVLAIDDDERNVDMFRSEGVFSLYRHSGYYER